MLPGTTRMTRTAGGRPRAWLLALTLLASTLLALPAEAARRVALVVGNGAYQNVTRLPNPTRDARAISTTLETVGFEVITALDLDADGMLRSVREFADKSRTAEVALFYYAGHGIQVDGQNYLLPISADIQRARDLAYEAVSLNQITTELEAAGPTLTLVLLDACRDNPLAELMRRNAGELGRNIQTGGGLARTQSAAGMLIAYATEPGAVALDGEGDNSPFTKALLEWMPQPGVEVGQLFRRVRERVMDLTGGTQVPWVEEAVLGEFYLNGAEIGPSADPEELFWQSVQGIESPRERLTALQRYMLVFPEGAYADEAQRLRRALVANLGQQESEPETPEQRLILSNKKATEQMLSLRRQDPAAAGANAARARATAEEGGCEVLAGDPLLAAGAQGRWIADRRRPLAPSVRRIDPDAAIRACEEALGEDQDNLRLQALLGRALVAGERWSEALRRLSPAAEQGDAVAQFALARMYLEGSRVATDPARAERLLQQAAAQGHVGAAFELGLMHRDGIAVAKDMVLAKGWLERGANGGYAWAQYELGALLNDGLAGQRDPVAAAGWWQRAAEQGHGQAALRLGLLLKHGDGVSKDPQAASRWLRLALVQGLTGAERPLADLLLTVGSGVDAEAEAAELLERAAKRGDDGAALLLGHIHAAGRLTVADPILAAYWFARAYDNPNIAGMAVEGFAGLPEPVVVEAIQQALSNAGHDPGDIDGYFGAKTAAAIRLFQQQHGLAQDQTPSIELLAALVGSNS
jgi:TPR repeat protein